MLLLLFIFLHQNDAIKTMTTIIQNIYEERVIWLKEKSKDENPEAQYWVGRHYSYGLGYKKNLETALLWFIKAAEQGHCDSQYNVAVCYENKWGVPPSMLKENPCDYSWGMTPSRKKAIEWYKKAAEQGDVDAKKALKRLSLFE